MKRAATLFNFTQTAPARTHMPNRPADSSEEAHQVGISQHFSSLIAHGLDELEEPPGRICSWEQVNAECAIAQFFQGMSYDNLRQNVRVHPCEKRITPVSHHAFSRTYSQAPSSEGLDRYAMPARLQQIPEPFYSHDLETRHALKDQVSCP